MSSYFSEFFNYTIFPYQSVFPQPFNDRARKGHEEHFPALYKWMDWKYRNIKTPVQNDFLTGAWNSCTRHQFGQDLSFRSKFSYDKDISELINTAWKDLRFKNNDKKSFNMLMFSVDPDPMPLDHLISEDEDLFNLLASKNADFGRITNSKNTGDRKRPKLRRKNRRAPRQIKFLEPILEVDEDVENVEEIVIPMNFLNKYPSNKDWYIDHIVSCGFSNVH